MPSFKRYEFFIGKGEPVEISEGEFQNAKKAKECLFPALFIEEQLDLILKNYADFDVTLYTIALKSVMYFPGGWKETIEDILLVNSKLINLLSTCRMYLDTAPQKLHAIYGNHHQSARDFVQATHHEYDNHLGYRFCSAMRNYTQHNDLPVHGLLLDGKWNASVTKCEHFIAVYTNISELEGTPFKTTVREELKAAYDDRLDIKPFIRTFVVCIGRINEVIRKQLDPDIGRWEKWIKSVVDKSSSGSNPILAHFDDEGELVDEVRISKDWAERLRTILGKNRNATHYDKHFINGDVMPPKPKRH